MKRSRGVKQAMCDYKDMKEIGQVFQFHLRAGTVINALME